ncbi:MAG: hypothetical protein IT428_30245 [Planctomycetaceae bacterium]|nr:hypothetical protein [Planctomycetaceae bacterium]
MQQYTFRDVDGQQVRRTVVSNYSVNGFSNFVSVPQFSTFSAAPFSTGVTNFSTATFGVPTFSVGVAPSIFAPMSLSVSPDVRLSQFSTNGVTQQSLSVDDRQFILDLAKILAGAASPGPGPGPAPAPAPAPANCLEQRVKAVEDFLVSPGAKFQPATCQGTGGGNGTDPGRVNPPAGTVIPAPTQQSLPAPATPNLGCKIDDLTTKIGGLQSQVAELNRLIAERFPKPAEAPKPLPANTVPAPVPAAPAQ